MRADRFAGGDIVFALNTDGRREVPGMATTDVLPSRTDETCMQGEAVVM